jgi:hypothetical protein
MNFFDTDNIYKFIYLDTINTFLEEVNVVALLECFLKLQNIPVHLISGINQVS